METDPVPAATPSRRTVLAAAASVIALGGALFEAAPAQADAMPTLGDVVKSALATKGQTLAAVKRTLGVTGTWAAFEGEWCAWYPTWLLRNNGIAFSGADFTVSALWEHYPAERRGSVPHPGALVFYSGHVGLVTDIVGGLPKSVEGNTGYYRGATDWTNSTVNTFTGGSARIIGYTYPQYAGYDSLTGAGTIDAPTDGNPLMALTDAEQAELLAGVRALVGFVYAGGTSVSAAVAGNGFDPHSLMGRVSALEEAVFSGGSAMPDGQRSIGESLAEIRSAVARKP